MLERSITAIPQARQLVTLAAFVALLAAFGPLPTSAQGEADRRPASSSSSKKPVVIDPEARKAAEESFLKVCQDPDAALSARTNAVAELLKLYTAAKAYPTLVTFCTRQLAQEKDPVTVTRLALALSSAQAALNDFANAATTLETFLEKNAATVPPSLAAQAATTLSALYAGALNQPQQAVAVLDRALAALPPDNAAERPALLLAKADLLAKQNDPAAAAAVYQQAIQAAAGQTTLLSQAQLGALQTLAAAGQKDKAVETALAVLASTDVTLTITTIIQKLLDLGASPDQLRAAAAVLQQRIVSQAAAQAAVELYQPSIVKLYASAGDGQRALQEARILILCCSDKTLGPAIELTAWTLKSVDHNLARANTFLLYQKSGAAGEDAAPGTPDDLPDILRTVPPLDDAQRAAPFLALMESLPTDWTGFRRRGEIYLYLDRPADAYTAFRRSFELCPMTEKELQSATDAMSGVIIRCTRDAALAETLVTFIMFGAVGKDGKPGSSDDLKDPNPDILTSLQLGVAAPASASAKSAPKPAPKAEAKLSDNATP